MFEPATIPPVGRAPTPPAIPAASNRASETAAEFEAMVLRPMVEAMVPHDGAMGEGTGAGAWRSIMVDALSTELARPGALGLDALITDTLAPVAVR